MAKPLELNQQTESGAVLMALEQVISGQKDLKLGQREVSIRLQNVEKNQSQFDSNIVNLKSMLEAHIKEDSKNIEDLKALIRSMVPDGNVDGHHNAHLEMIRSAQKWNDLKFNILKHLASWGSVGLVIFFGKAVFDHIMKIIHG